jgi:hypothetical protein
MRGPSVETLRAHVKDMGLLHYEMMQALPGKREALIEERRMENAFNRNRGRGETLIFVREAGSDWDVVTLGASPPQLGAMRQRTHSGDQRQRGA